jgi:hypothetical protein
MNRDEAEFMVRNAVRGESMPAGGAGRAPWEAAAYASSACGAGSFVAVARVALARFSTSSERVCDTT